jgi:hypothetical protein
MKSWILLRALAVVLAVFTLGHTLGTAAPKVTRGEREAALFTAMQSYRFPIMGFNRSYWEFYRGFAITISVLMLLMMVLAWQLGSMSRRDPRGTLPLAITLQFACIGMLVVGWFFFFGAPIVFSALSVVLSTIAVVSLLWAGKVEGEGARAKG